MDRTPPPKGLASPRPPGRSTRYFVKAISNYQVHRQPTNAPPVLRQPDEVHIVVAGTAHYKVRNDNRGRSRRPSLRGPPMGLQSRPPR
jgi:hypothetical protein